MTNPFSQLAARHPDLARLAAIAVSTAHNDSAEVWAACRALDKVHGFAGGTVSSGLSGRYFTDYVCSVTGEIEALDELRDLAHAYYDGLTCSENERPTLIP